jgi:HK97 family phage major capsid protein
MKSVELRETRAKIVADSRKLINTAEAENRDLTAEERQQFESMMADVDSLAVEIEKSERKEKVELLEAEQRSIQPRKTNPSLPPQTADEYRAALRNWCLLGTGKEDSSADMQFRMANHGFTNASLVYVRALSKGTATAGGHTVPLGFVNELEKKLKWYAPIRNVVRVIKTETGQDLDYPRVDDTANNAGIVAEAGTLINSPDPTFDKITFKAYKYSSPIIKVSAELLADSAFDIEAELADLLTQRIARGQEAHFVAGDNSSKPQGLTTGATSGAQLAGGNAFTGDKLIDLFHSVDIAYRQNGAWLMHDLTLAAIRKVKDTTNQYLWQPGLTAGAPDTLLGKPVYVSNSFAEYAGSEGTNKPLVLFGDFNKYVVRDVTGAVTLQRLNELYAATNEIGFVLHTRADGRYAGHSGCVKSLNSA